MRRTTGALRTYLPPARSPGRNRSEDCASPAQVGMERHHDRVEQERRRVQGEHGGHPDLGDEQAGDRRADGAGQVDVDRAESRGGRQLLARDHVRHQGLVGGRDQDGAGAQHEGEHQQQGGRHPVRRGQHGERRTGGGHAGQDRDEQPDPVEYVGQHATHQREQDGGQRVGGLDERDQDGRVSVVDHQPLGAHGLHPGAHVADQRRDPQRPEQPDAQRRPGRRGRPRAGRAAFHLPRSPGAAHGWILTCGGRQAPRRSRTAWTMWAAEIPAASMSSAGVPEPGRPRTARWVIWTG